MSDIEHNKRCFLLKGKEIYVDLNCFRFCIFTVTSSVLAIVFMVTQKLGMYLIYRCVRGIEDKSRIFMDVQYKQIKTYIYENII